MGTSNGKLFPIRPVSASYRRVYIVNDILPMLDTTNGFTYFNGTTTPDFIFFAAANTLFSVKRFNRPIYPSKSSAIFLAQLIYNNANVRNLQVPKTMP